MKITPRVYQLAAVRAALKGLRSRLRRALVVLATGLGKTLTAALITKEMGSKRVLFLVHNNFILEHAMDEFRLVFGPRIKMAIYNGRTKEGVEEANIVFATWQTMGRNLKQWSPDYFELLIADEAHHVKAKTYWPVLNYFRAPKLGITATPDRTDNTDIRDAFGSEVINVTLEEAIARGWLPKIEYHVITDESLDEEALQKVAAEIREGKKRFTMAEVNRRIFIRKRDAEIARMINAYKEKAVVFCANIAHAERLSQYLEKATTFHSSKGESDIDTWTQNQAALNELNRGTIKRVCAVNAFNEGVNVPSVGLVAFCRSTSALTVFRQQLGRGLRPGKEKLVVLDFVGNLERIQLVLSMMEKVADIHEQHTSKRERDREGYTREAFEVSGRGFEFTFSDYVVDIMEILGHVEKDYYPTLEEASKAAQRLNIRTEAQYQSRYKEDPRLHSRPHKKYPNFPGWKSFLNTKRDLYPTVEEASAAAQRLKIRTYEEYKKRCREDPRLPYKPDEVYSPFPRWKDFLGTKKDFYPTWKQASKAARRLGIKSSIHYKKVCGRVGKVDPRLPSSPFTYYADFPGWHIFLTGKERPQFYPSWQEAIQACLKLGIRTSVAYHERFKKDPRLPSDLRRVYPDFPGWPACLKNANTSSTS